MAFEDFFLFMINNWKSAPFNAWSEKLAWTQLHVTGRALEKGSFTFTSQPVHTKHTWRKLCLLINASWSWQACDHEQPAEVEILQDIRDDYHEDLITSARAISTADLQLPPLSYSMNKSFPSSWYHPFCFRTRLIRDVL